MITYCAMMLVPSLSNFFKKRRFYEWQAVGPKTNGRISAHRDATGITLPVDNDTARRWLHRMGCAHTAHIKAMYVDGHERKDVVEYRLKFVARMLKAFRRTYMWRAVLPGDPAIKHLTDSGVKLSAVTDEHGVEWIEYCSDDVGECEIRGELTKDASVWVNADGTRNKPIIFFEQGDMCPTSFAGRADFKYEFWT